MAPLFSLSRYLSKQQEVVLFSSTAVALYGYDQGMMSLVNTNYDYLNTMGISGESPWVGVIVSVHYIGTAMGAFLGSWWANKKGRRASIFTGIATASVGNILMFITGLGAVGSGKSLMIIGRLIMGIGIGAPPVSKQFAISIDMQYQAPSTLLSPSTLQNSLVTTPVEKHSVKSFKQMSSA